MAYLGDIRIGKTIGGKFTTRQISGAPTTLSSSPVLSAYAAGSNSPITAGFALTVDYPKTGLNDWTLVASSGNGFATGTNYQVVITTGTVNSVSVVGEVIAEFSIEARSALMPATADRTAVVDAAGLIDSNMVKNGPSGSGAAVAAGAIPNAAANAAGGLLISSAGSLDMDEMNVDIEAIQAFGAPPTVAAIATGVWQDTTAGDFTVALSIGKSVMNGVALGTGLTINGYTGNTPQTGDSFARIGATGSGLTSLAQASIWTSTVANHIDADISSRLASASYTAPDNTSITAIKVQTDKLVFTAPGYVDVNVLKQNGTAMYGTGASGDLWRGTP